MDITTFSIESEKNFFIKKSKASKRFSKYKKTKNKKSLSVKNLYEILADNKNKGLLADLKVTNSSQQNISFKLDNKGNLVLETNNKKEIFTPSISNGKLDIKKTREETKSETNMIIKTFSNNFESTEQFNSNNEKVSEEIINHKDNIKRYTQFSKEGITVRTLFDDNEKNELFAPNGKKLSEEFINHKDNSREYTEFHKTGNTKLKMQTDDNGKQNYILESYGKDNNLIKTEKPFWKDGDDFETVKGNNILGHKQKFSLNERAQNEKYFRDLGITTNINSIRYFNKAFKDIKIDEKKEQEIKMAVSKYFGYENYHELENSMNGNKELSKKVNSLFLTKRNMEILKDNSSTLKEISDRTEKGRIISKYSVKIKEKEETFEVEKAKIFDDKDKLKVKCENGELKLECDSMSLEPGKKYFFTVPNKDGSIYLFDKDKGEHHSNFSWDKERNHDFSIVSGGYFILDDDGKIAKITNYSGHFQPTSKDSTESFLRTLAKNMVSSLNEKGLDAKSKSIEDLLSKDKKIGNEGYNISVDTTKCEADSITVDSEEPEATTIISKRKLDLIYRNAMSNVISRSV